MSTPGVHAVPFQRCNCTSNVGVPPNVTHILRRLAEFDRDILWMLRDGRCHEGLHREHRAPAEHQASAVVDEHAVHRAGVRRDDRTDIQRVANGARDRVAVHRPLVAQTRAVRSHEERGVRAFERRHVGGLLRDHRRAEQNDARRAARYRSHAVGDRDGVRAHVHVGDGTEIHHRRRGPRELSTIL